MNVGSHASFCLHAQNFSFINKEILKTDRAVESSLSIYLNMYVIRIIEGLQLFVT